jgi:hypothetical protein
MPAAPAAPSPVGAPAKLFEVFAVGGAGIGSGFMLVREGVPLGVAFTPDQLGALAHFHAAAAR